MYFIFLVHPDVCRLPSRVVPGIHHLWLEDLIQCEIYGSTGIWCTLIWQIGDWRLTSPTKITEHTVVEIEFNPNLVSP